MKRQRAESETSEEMEIEDCEVNENESNELENLLKLWGVESLLTYFNSIGITVENMMDVEETDYKFLMQNRPKMFGKIISFRRFHRKWKQKNKEDSEKVNVETILEHEKGHEIKEFFKENGTFSHKMRLKMGYLILEGRKVSRGMMSDIAEQIVAIFSGERKEHFYQKLRGRPATGVLIVCFNALNAKAAKSRSKTNLPTETKAHKFISLSIESTDAEESECLLNTIVSDDGVEAAVSDEVRSSIDILNNAANMGNDDLIYEHWAATYTYRTKKTYKTAEEAINDWRPLREPIGSLLMHYDFVKLYGKESGDALTGFNNFISENHQELSNEIKNALVRQQLQEALSERDHNTQSRKIVMALFNLNCMVPVTVSTKKSRWTPTIPDSQNAFCLTVLDSIEMEKKLKQRILFCNLKGMDVAPILFHFSRTDEYFVRYKEILYKGETFLDTVDIAFKIFAIYKVSLPLDSSKVWHFLNEVFYKIQFYSGPTSELTSKMSTFKY